MPRRLFPLFLLLLASCAAGPGTGEGTTIDTAAPELEESQSGLAGVLQFTHGETEARAFIRRYASLSVGLVNYFDPSRCELIARDFSAETVVFRLDGTGDYGPLLEAAADRAIEMVDEFRWPEVEAGNEHFENVALVKVESIGIPAGARAGDMIPARMTVMGNASDIRGGYVYNTPLKNRRGRTVAILMQGYLPFAAEKAVTPEQREDSKLMERREGTATPTFILRAGVKLAANIASDELTADKIVLPLMREIAPGTGKFKRTLSADLVPQVLPQIEQKMAAMGIACRAEHEGNNIVVTPLGVREINLRQVFEKLQTLRVTIAPRSNVLVIFDDAIVRVAVYGPPQHRLLLRDVALTVDPFTRGKPNVAPMQSRFKVSCRVLQRAEPGRSGRYGVPSEEERAAGKSPDGHLGRVRLSWSRWNKDGRMIAEGTDELASTDISDVLRFLWTRRMKPPEVLGFVIEAKDAAALACELGFNWRKVDVDKMRREMESDTEEESRNQ